MRGEVSTTTTLRGKKRRRSHQGTLRRVAMPQDVLRVKPIGT